MKLGSLFGGLIVVAAVASAVGYAVRTNGTTPSPDKIRNRPVAQPTPAEERWRVPLAASASRGPEDALVTVVELGDFQCPFSLRALPVLAKLEETYRGEVRFVFKHFPLASHADAALAAEYAAAAGEQGKFWSMHDRLFAGQASLGRDSLRRYLQEAGADVERGESFISSGRARTAVGEDRALGARLGVTGTPAFYVNGVKINGLVTLPVFQKVIDTELATARQLLAAGVARGKIYDELMKKAREAPLEVARRPQQIIRQNVSLVADAPRRGAKEPLVTVVEYSDFECPFCSSTNPMLSELVATYGDAVAVEFRHRPLEFHPRAMAAAAAAVAAHKQGKFWEFHDALFADQKKLSDADFEKLAVKLKLKLDKFKRDLDDPTTAAVIERDKEDATRYGVRGTPTMFVDGIPVRGVQPIGLVRSIVDRELALAEKLIAGGTKRSEVYGAIMRAEGGRPFDPSLPLVEGDGASVTVGDAPVRGPRTAPVKVIVWSDFECEHCAKVAPWLAEAGEKYGERVVVAFKHYPLPTHPHAELAAVASLAAARQGKFWEMHDKLFAERKSLARADLVRHAAAIGLDAEKLSRDLDDPELRLWVKRDTADGVGLNITGTPTLFINGRRLEGVRSVEELFAAIDDELKKRS